MRERIDLTFPKDLTKEPILSLAKQFDIAFNIRGSTATSEMRGVALAIDGKDGEVARRLPGLKRKVLLSN